MKRASDPDTEASFAALIAQRDREVGGVDPDDHHDQRTGDDNGDRPTLGWVDRLEVSLVPLSEPDWWTSDTGADWLVEPIIPARRATSITSAPKIGKSLLTLEIAAALAAGRAILDRPAGERVHVIYCDLEMSPDDLRERLTDMGYGPGDDLGEHLHYYSLPSFPPLDTADGGLALSDITQHHRAELVVIDTTSRVIGGEENAADTFANYWRHTGAPLKAAGVAVLRLDHSGHSDPSRARGSSAKAADVDLAWIIEPTDDGIRLRRTHQRIGWAPEKVTLTRSEDPLRHVLVAGGWPAGTAEVARLLDDLGVGVDASRRAAQAALKAAGESRRNDVVGAAVKYRRTRDEVVGGSGTTSGPLRTAIGDHLGDQHPKTRVLQGGTTSRDHAGPLPESSGTLVPPHRGDQDPDQPATEPDSDEVDNDPRLCSTCNERPAGSFTDRCHRCIEVTP